jgi:hypothetical protein
VLYTEPGLGFRHPVAAVVRSSHNIHPGATTLPVFEAGEAAEVLT